MIPELIVQRPVDFPNTPDDTTLQLWLEATPATRLEQEMTLVVRIVDEAESQTLNRDFRGKDKPTNVLSFPYDPLPGMPDEHLGDLVICAPVVEREALEQHKSSDAHWAHMLVHGVLHLLGYDHQNEQEAQEMEQLEATILDQLGFPNPYEEVSIDE